jgi:methionine biosynthesis protein MetW
LANNQERFYEEYWAYRLRKGWVHNREERFSRFSTIVSLVGSDKRILDVGCGEGFLAKLLEKKGNNVVGIDISERVIELARKDGVNAIKCNVEDGELPFHDRFDVIILSEVLEHLISPVGVIQKLKKHLNQNGYFLLTFPNIAFYEYRLQLLFGRFPRQYVYDSREHLHYWSLPDFMDFVASCGLVCNTIKPVLAFPLHSIVFKIKPLALMLEKLSRLLLPNLFGIQIIVKASHKRFF